MKLLYRRTNKAEYTIHRGYTAATVKVSYSPMGPDNYNNKMPGTYGIPPHANHMVLRANKLELQITQRIRKFKTVYPKYQNSTYHLIISHA